MSPIPDDIDWSLTTWEGSRRAQLRRSLQLTLRERLQALDDMTEIAERFRWMRETGKFSTGQPAQAASPAAVAQLQGHAGGLRDRGDRASGANGAGAVGGGASGRK